MIRVSCIFYRDLPSIPQKITDEYGDLIIFEENFEDKNLDLYKDIK